MKYLGTTKLSKLKEEEKAGYIAISDNADAIIEEIKIGFEKLRLTTLLKR